MPQLKNGLFVPDARLDRIYEEDARTREYPIRRLVSLDKPLRSYTWAVNNWFDQGYEGACVEYAIGHELVARPSAVNPTHVKDIIDEHGIYWPAQQRDPWEGGSYPGAQPEYEGTSVLAGMEVAAEMGYYQNYLWAQSEKEIALAIGYKGPVVLGINWYEGMYDVDSDGYIAPTGDIVGGHSTLLFGLNLSGGYYKVWNSWGTSWGWNGQAKLRREHMAELLSQDGEACLPTRTALVD